MIQFLAGLLGLPESALRLLAALLMTYPIGYGWRTLIPTSDPTKRDIFSALGGIFIAYFMFGGDVVQSLGSIILTWLVLLLAPSRKLANLLVFTGNMGHLLLGYWYFSTDGYDIDWTTSQCVLTLRLISLGWDYFDGGKPENTLVSDQKVNALRELPSLISVLGYCYFPSSFLIGPQFPYQTYHKFVRGTSFPEGKMPSGWIEAARRSFTFGCIYLAVNTVLGIFFPVSILTSQQYLESSFFNKLFLMTISLKVSMWKYLGVWLLAEGACIVSGVSYGKNIQGKTSWHALANVRPYLFETSPSLNGIIASFNINTNDWVKRYIFKRVITVPQISKNPAAKEISLLSSLFFLAIWHGFAPGYFFTFFLEFVELQGEMAITKIATAFKIPANPATLGVAWVLRNIGLSYGLVAFDLKTLSLSIQGYNQLYWIGHLFCLAVVAISYALPRAPRAASDSNVKKEQ